MDFSGAYAERRVDTGGWARGRRKGDSYPCSMGGCAWIEIVLGVGPVASEGGFGSVPCQVEKARNPGRTCLRDVQLHHTRHSYVSYSCRTAVCVVQCASAAGKLIHAHAYPSLPSSAHFYGISQKIPNHAEDRALNLHFGSPNPPSRKQKSAADHTHDAEVLTSHSSM
ncbi:hypothetical protein IG631_16244 [Alternaria alternata]|nr:hypothetical protein IG631_16244 [Alternaria alternata]